MNPVKDRARPALGGVEHPGREAAPDLVQAPDGPLVQAVLALVAQELQQRLLPQQREHDLQEGDVPVLAVLVGRLMLAHEGAGLARGLGLEEAGDDLLRGGAGRPQDRGPVSAETHVDDGRSHDQRARDLRVAEHGPEIRAGEVGILVQQPDPLVRLLLGKQRGQRRLRELELVARPLRGELDVLPVPTLVELQPPCLVAVVVRQEDVRAGASQPSPDPLDVLYQ
mmetsp:Transcript_111291/g.295784  ORF Transcript_111291/g.295784 Transcript_111291/m.295784 type:complete len:225 (-) Transcript_111291:331-1005(-)